MCGLLNIDCSIVGSLNDRLDLADGGLEVPPLIIEEMLPVREWLARIVDRLLDVSEEMVDSGRGINSIVSENPTRGRGKVFAWLSSVGMGVGGSSVGVIDTSR